MQAGIPIIASNTGGIPDIIKHNKTGLLFEVNNQTDFQEKLLSLISSEDLKTSFVVNARQHASKYTPENMATSYIKLYKEII